jgi:oligopeptide/dipeptide ABC transporter ATP-binding protein
VGAEAPLLEVRGLGVRYPGVAAPALAGVDLTLARGASLGLVGESGAGKSQLALAVGGLLPAAAEQGGSVRLAGLEPRAARRAGTRVGFVFQDPQSALAPHLSVGRQLTETLHARLPIGRAAARAAALATLERVRVPEPARRLEQYPHELSGGLRQRVLIAIALLTEPALLVADEPTTALDVTVEAGILALFRALRAELGMALLLVSHDLAVVGGLCERIAVMYAGRIVEQGPAAPVLRAPRHPYTAALAAASPRLDEPVDAPAATIPGSAPLPGERQAGCAFAPRCPRAIDRCRHELPRLTGAAGTEVACHRPLGGVAP